MDEPLNAGDEVILYVSQGPDPEAEANPDGENSETAREVTLNRSSVSLYVGDTTTLSANGGGSYTWSSSDTGVAIVNNGTVTAVGRGSATITVRSGNSVATCSVTVQDYTLSLSESHISLFEGDSRTISAYGVPAGSSVSWSSSNSQIATVSGGRITAVASGSATITAQFTTAGRAYSDTCQVTVSSSGITLSQYSITSLYVGESETISATTSPSGQSVSWSSSNTRVVTVSSGRITAVGAGSATITASFSYGGTTYSESCSVTVREVSVSISSSSETLIAGEETTLRATTSPSAHSVSWSSSNTRVATVNSSGRVTAVGSGSATITAEISVNGQSYTDTCRVTVEEPSIRLSSTSLSMSVGDAKTLSASLTPNGTYISWSSSNTDVATVNNSGRVTAEGDGSATITAEIVVNGRSYSDSCRVTVEAPSIRLSTSNLLMDVGETYTLSATVTPRGSRVTWSSSDNDVFTVNSSGQVTAQGVGTATLTAMITSNGGDYTATCTVTVEEDLWFSTSISGLSAQCIDGKIYLDGTIHSLHGVYSVGIYVVGPQNESAIETYVVSARGDTSFDLSSIDVTIYGLVSGVQYKVTVMPDVYSYDGEVGLGGNFDTTFTAQ